MKNFIFLGLSIIFLNIFLVGCASTKADSNMANGGRNTLTIDSDQNLQKEISCYLNNLYPGNNIKVTVYNDDVLLTGQVANSSINNSIKDSLENKAGVIYNYIEVKPVESIQQQAYDAYISHQTQTKLMTIKGIQNNNIKFTTTDRVIYLFGNITDHQSKKVTDRLQKINGVKNIIIFFDYTSNA